MARSLVTLLLAALCTSAAAQKTWTLVSQPFSPGIGSRPATFLSMALGKSQGSEIHLAYVGAGSDQNALAAAHSSWLGWVQVGDAGVTSTAEASPAHTSVAVDPGSGVPLVAFRDNTAGAGGVSVKVWERTLWLLAGAPNLSGGEADDVKLLYPSGFWGPVVCYQDVAAGRKLSCKRFVNGGWSFWGPAGFTPGQANYLSMAYDPKGDTILVAFQDQKDSQARGVVMRYNKNTQKWGVQAPAAGPKWFSSGQADDLSLAIHPGTGLPWVAYRDGGSNALTVVRQTAAGGPWVAVGSLGTAGQGSNSHALAIDSTSNFVPWLAYQCSQTNRKLCASTWTGSTWKRAGTSFSSGDVAYINLRLQDGTVPVVAYVDYSLSGRPVVQRYA